jgi:hypothetical protein
VLNIVALSVQWKKKSRGFRMPRNLSPPPPFHEHRPANNLRARAIHLENIEMTRTWLAATAALSLMTGSALAQSTALTTTSTESTTITPVAPMVVVPAPSFTESSRTVDDNGVVTDQTKTSTNDMAVSPSGDTTMTHRTTKTTTVR